MPGVEVVELVVVLALVPVVIILLVLLFCVWLVHRTGKAESLREVAPILWAMRDLVRVRQRRP